MKNCNKCKKSKSEKDFYFRAGKEGLNGRIRSVCKSCFVQERSAKTVSIKNLILEKYGNKCACCNESIREFLCLDHVNNDGNKQRKNLSRRRFFTWIVSNGFPNSIQILCFNCNSAKEFYGKCPHNK